MASGQPHSACIHATPEGSEAAWDACPRGSGQTDRSRAVNDTIKASHPSTGHVGAFPFSHPQRYGQLQITPSDHHEECTMLGQRAINRCALDGWMALDAGSAGMHTQGCPRRSKNYYCTSSMAEACCDAPGAAIGLMIAGTTVHTVIQRSDRWAGRDRWATSAQHRQGLPFTQHLAQPKIIPH